MLVYMVFDCRGQIQGVFTDATRAMELLRRLLAFATLTPDAPKAPHMEVYLV